MSNERYIQRFSKFIVIAHWTNAISFIMLVLTGLPLFLGVKVPEILQIVHRVFAVTFLLPTPFMILMDRKGFLQWTKSAFSWSKRDFQFLAVFPLELIGKAKNIPINLKNSKIILSRMLTSYLKRVDEIDEALIEKGYNY